MTCISYTYNFMYMLFLYTHDLTLYICCALYKSVVFTCLCVIYSFLYLWPLTHSRTQAVVDTVLRLRRVRHMELRQQSALEAAYFAVCPPEHAVREVKVSLQI